MDNIDSLALATWFMDDGSYYYNSTNRGSRMKIATCSFTDDEQNLMINYFQNKWELNPKINYDNKNYKYPVLYFNADDARRMVEIIRPHVIPSMEYKLDAKVLS